MRLSVLDLTHSPSPLLDGVARPGILIVDWLRPALPEAIYQVHEVANGEPMPGVSAFDGLLVSGSELGVYDAAAWMAPLRGLLTETKAAGKPIFGICFGHQIMADTFGGKAEKAGTGVVVGRRVYEIDGQQVDTHVWHQDQVTKVPPGASITMSADYCPVGGLAYDFPALSLQPHPEYDEPHLRELFDVGRNNFITPEDADAAVASFQGGRVSPSLMAAETAAFFRRHLD